MKLRGIEFGAVLGASGVQGFFGEGYWYHELLRPIGLDFTNATFVAKTTTLRHHKGNMPLDNEHRPQKLLPPCIVVKLLDGVTLNAVGLSGPGAETLFSRGDWQRRTRPFFISFMSIAETPATRLGELRDFIDLLFHNLYDFRARVGLQINYSCPNVGLHAGNLVSEVMEGLDIAAELGIPLVPKFNVLLPLDAAREISRHPACDALCISNTIPWGALPDRINWQGLFGSVEFPLARYGGGGLSGKPLLPLLLEWLEAAKVAGVRKPINAGGGILSLADAREVLRTGASSIFLGSIALLRPWRVRGIIRSLQR